MARKTADTPTEKKKSAAPKKGTRPVAATTTTRRDSRRTLTKQKTAATVESNPAPAVRRKPVFQAGTWISILMLAALVGLAFYLNREKEKTGAQDVTPTLETTYIFTAADGIVSSIEVKPAEGETVKIARNAENAWAVTLPIEAEANQGMAEAAATQVSALSIVSPIDGKPGVFGFDNPAYIITIEFKNGAKHTLEVGDTTPTNSGYYVRVDKDKMMITDLSGIDALLQIGFFPPYLNTPTPTSLPPTATPVPPTETSTPVP